jgi:hypothetical protein
MVLLRITKQIIHSMSKVEVKKEKAKEVLLKVSKEKLMIPYVTNQSVLNLPNLKDPPLKLL